MKFRIPREEIPIDKEFLFILNFHVDEKIFLYFCCYDKRNIFTKFIQNYFHILFYGRTILFEDKILIKIL